MPISGYLRSRLHEPDGLRLLLTRYLQAFGPATLADAVDLDGRAANASRARRRRRWISSRTAATTMPSSLDLADMVLPDPDTPAPVRFLPTWDATLLAHCRRSGILPEEFRTKIFHTKIPQSVGTVLVDGSVAATWVWRNDRVEVHELAKLKPAQRREVADEAER